MSVQEVFLLLLSNQEMAKIVREIVIKEDNHVLAIFLSHIPHYRAADILDNLPTERRNLILLKIATIQSVSKNEIEKVKDMIVDKINVFVNNGEWKEYREMDETPVSYTKDTVKSIYSHLDLETRKKLENEGYRV